MNTKRDRTPIKKSRLENEVILSVVILYVLLSAALLLIHHVQPDEIETLTSSTSPSHAPAPAAPAAPAPALSTVDAQKLLSAEGYRDIHDLRRKGGAFHAVAVRDGVGWRIELDAASRVIIATATTAPAPVR